MLKAVGFPQVDSCGRCRERLVIADGKLCACGNGLSVFNKKDCNS